MSKHRLSLVMGMSLVLASAVCSNSVLAADASTTTESGYCDPAVLQTMIASYKNNQDDLDDSLEPLAREIKKTSDSSIVDLSSCVDLSWPTMSFQYPTMDQIVRGVAKQVVNKACSAARSVVSETKSKFTNSFYLNPRISGVPAFKVATGTSQSGSSVRVNGDTATYGSGATPSSSSSSGSTSGSNPTSGLFGGGGGSL